MGQMHGVRQDGYGGTEVLRPATLPMPAPSAREVLVHVEAAALDRGTWHVMTGLPRIARVGLGLRRPRNQVPGLDVAGVVEAVGPGVTAFAVGDPVFGTARGSFADYAIARVDTLVRRPACLTATQAAALGVSGCTAVQALDAARVGEGSSVLVVGASGGVGSLAVMIAALRGADVTAVCSGSKADAVRGWGARHILDYAQNELAHDTTRYDAVLDIAGGTSLNRLRELTAPRGSIVFVGQEGGGEWTGGFGAPMRNAVRMLPGRQRYVMLMSRVRSADLAQLAALADADGLRPHLHATFTLSEVRSAMDCLISGAVVGKIAVVPDHAA